jgi:hypothetical protein
MLSSLADTLKYISTDASTCLDKHTDLQKEVTKLQDKLRDSRIKVADLQRELRDSRLQVTDLQDKLRRQTQHPVKSHGLSGDAAANEVGENTTPVASGASDMEASFVDRIMELFYDMMELFYEKYRLSKKPTMSDNVLWMTKAIRMLPEDLQLEFALQMSEQEGETEYLKLVSYGDHIVSQLNSKDPESDEYRSLLGTLDQLAELKAHDRFKAEIVELEQLDTFQSVVSKLDECKTQHAKFSVLLRNLGVETTPTDTSSHEDDHTRWARALRLKSSGAVSYTLLKRVLNKTLRLHQILQKDVTLVSVSQATSFRFSALMYEEALAMMHTLMQNEFSSGEHLTAKGLQTWFNSLDAKSSGLSNTQKGVMGMFKHMICSKPMSPVYKKTYSFARKAFLQTQEKAKLPHLVAKAKLRKVKQELDSERTQLSDECSSKKQFSHRENIKRLSAQLDEAEKTVHHALQFPYGEAEFDKHCAWMKTHVDCGDVFEALGC